MIPVAEYSTVLIIIGVESQELLALGYQWNEHYTCWR